METPLTFGDMYTYPKLKKHDGLFGNIPIRFGDIYIGIEVEAEHAENLNPNPSSSWKVVPDGSLKRNGLEFVTYPIELKYMEMELIRLFGSMNGVYTNRTSIHVHMNARDFTYEELTRFLLLYVVYEKCLYHYSGNRYLNEYCVPICESTDNLITNINNIKQGYNLGGWCKYYGLNLRPLYTEERFGGQAHPRIGTIEFRHLEGTNDVRRIINWCNLITCLKLTAKQIKTETLVDNIVQRTMSHKEVIESIFKSWSNLLPTKNRRKDISFGTDKAKYVIACCGLVGVQFREKTKKPYLDPTMVTHTVEDGYVTAGLQQIIIDEPRNPMGFDEIFGRINKGINSLGKKQIETLDRWLRIKGFTGLHDHMNIIAQGIARDHQIEQVIAYTPPPRTRNELEQNTWADYIFTGATGTTFTGGR